MTVSSSVPLRRPLLLLAAAVCAGSLVLPAAGAASAPSAGRAAPAAGAVSVPGGGETAKGKRTVRHDVTFIAMFVPHHREAVRMSRVAERRAADRRVRRLAARIAVTQSRQIRQMRAWLHRHRAAEMPPPAAVREMERQDLRMLRSAKGREVDRMFLMMMRMHHAQAVSETQDELEHGRDAFARRLARTANVQQTREIALMNDLLADLSRH